jgi:hypothetical protein
VDGHAFPRERRLGEAIVAAELRGVNLWRDKLLWSNENVTIRLFSENVTP